MNWPCGFGCCMIRQFFFPTVFVFAVSFYQTLDLCDNKALLKVMRKFVFLQSITCDLYNNLGAKEEE